MTKIRVHEYAKQVNRTSKEVIDELGKINVNVANHMSTIDNEAITKLDSKFGGNKTNQAGTESKRDGATNIMHQHGTSAANYSYVQQSSQPSGTK